MQLHDAVLLQAPRPQSPIRPNGGKSYKVRSFSGTGNQIQMLQLQLRKGHQFNDDKPCKVINLLSHCQSPTVSLQLYYGCCWCWRVKTISKQNAMLFHFETVSSFSINDKWFSFHHRMRDRNIVLLATQLRLCLKKVSTQSLAECNFIRSTSLAPLKTLAASCSINLRWRHLFRNLDIQKKQDLRIALTPFLERKRHVKSSSLIVPRLTKR